MDIATCVERVITATGDGDRVRIRNEILTLVSLADDPSGHVEIVFRLEKHSLSFKYLLEEVIEQQSANFQKRVRILP